MKPIEQTTLSKPIYERLKAMIINHELKPGEKIIQEKIAALLGVSRTPLMKALQMLEHEFLLESIPRRGMFVRRIEINEIIDAFECREALEGIAVRRCAEKITPEEIQSLKDIFTPFIDKDDIDREKYSQADQEFHNALIRFSENSILTRFEILNNIIYRTYEQGLVRPPSETLKEHLEVISALETGNSKAAEKLMRKHLSRSVKSIRKNFSAGENLN